MLGVESALVAPMNTLPSTPSGQPPALRIEGAVATLTLRRPAMANRLDLADIDTLLTQLEQVNAQAQVRVLRLCGQGQHFCSGFNIGQIGAEAQDPGSRFEALANAVENARPVTLAVLQGGVYGGAFDLALACDFRLGTPACEARVPAARLGLHYYRSGMERMVTRLGLSAAKRVLLAVEALDATELHRLQYLDSLVPAQALWPQAEALSQSLAQMAPLALLPMKKNLNLMARELAQASALQHDIATTLNSEDLREGAAAWAQKRTPVFTGR
jgi:enoyl-CoA hydratase